MSKNTMLTYVHLWGFICKTCLTLSCQMAYYALALRFYRWLYPLAELSYLRGDMPREVWSDYKAAVNGGFAGAIDVGRQTRTYLWSLRPTRGPFRRKV